MVICIYQTHSDEATVIKTMEIDLASFNCSLVCVVSCLGVIISVLVFMGVSRNAYM